MSKTLAIPVYAISEGDLVKSSRMQHLDGWRGIAILLLLVGHFAPPLGLAFGTAGVDFFFALSGLLMGRLLFVQNTPIPIFYRRRISRIFPAFYFFLLTVVVANIFFAIKVDWAEVLVPALFVYNYFPVPSAGDHMPFGHIWSLSVEEHSYIILSLVALWSRRTSGDPMKPIGVLVLLSGLFGVIYPAFFSGSRLGDVLHHTEVQGFKIFISVYFMLVFSRIKVQSFPWWTCPVLLSLTISLYWWSVPFQFRFIVASMLLALCVNILCFAPGNIVKAFSVAPLRKLGIWSYSIYLWQQPFYIMQGPDFPWWIAIPCGIAAGIFSFFFVENPVRRYLNNSWSRA